MSLPLAVRRTSAGVVLAAALLTGCARGSESLGLDFFSLSPWMNLAVFAAAGAVVWAAGTRLARYVNEIAERTGLGKAFLGALMLGGITSLPEVATTITSSVGGDAELAVNNIFGSIAMNVLLLAVVADVVDGGRALTAQVNQSTLILQGALSILVIAVAAAAALLSDIAVLGVGVGSTVLFLVALMAFYLAHRFQDIQRWAPVGTEGEPPGGAREWGAREPVRRAREAQQEVRRLATPRLALYTAAAALGILVAGYFLSRTGSAIAQQTGLGSSLVGFLLLALGTSLPEISTLVSAVRLGQFSLVFSEIFGTNIFNASIIFYTDLVYLGRPLLEEVGLFAQTAALLGIVLTAVYLVGLITRSEHTSLFHLGKDSLAVIALYMLGVGVLFTLR